MYGKDGKPLHSWRVLLLPYIEQGELYRKFRLDEPWDSPHNLALLPQMPRTYTPPWDWSGTIPPHHTAIHVFVGRGAAFEGKQGLRQPEDFPDGPGNTIMVVEGGPPVPWTKPEDLTYDPDTPLPDLCTVFQGGFRVLMADGTDHWVKRDVREQTLRAAITRNGGEVLGPDW